VPRAAQVETSASKSDIFVALSMPGAAIVEKIASLGTPSAALAPARASVVTPRDARGVSIRGAQGTGSGARRVERRDRRPSSVEGGNKRVDRGNERRARRSSGGSRRTERRDRRTERRDRRSERLDPRTERRCGARFRVSECAERWHNDPESHGYRQVAGVSQIVSFVPREPSPIATPGSSPATDDVARQIVTFQVDADVPSSTSIPSSVSSLRSASPRAKSFAARAAVRSWTFASITAASSPLFVSR